MNIKRTLLFTFLLIQVISFACHDTEILSVTSTNNGNNTTTFNIECKIGVGTLDGYSYGFALIFSNSTGTAPVVLTSPAFTPTLTRPGYDPLTGYTGSSIGTGTAVTYFSSRYSNRSDVLSYESDDDWFGFGSSTYIRTITVTLQGCVENIHLDGDFRSSGTAVADVTCGDDYLTGFSCCSTVNSSLDTTLCNGGSIVVNGTTYDGSNPTGQEIFTLAGGCDSIVTITVTELAAITNSINPTICSNGSYVYDGVTYDANNTTGTHIFTSTLGCDSTVTVTLTIQNVINTNLDTTLCNGGFIVVNGTTYDGSNPTGQEIFTLAGGCDSIVTITVTELAAITNSINPTICSNGSYVYDGVTYDANNTTGTHIFTSALGCDSTVTVTLTIQNVINTNLDTTLCNGGSIVVNGTTYDGSNPTGQETFTLAGGCDSIVTITVTELAAITNSINPTICSNGSYVYDGVTYDANNTTGTHIFTSALGCDSTVTVTLTIQNVINTNLDTTLCNGGSIVVNGTTYDGSNPTGQETFTLAGGCDSIVTITVTELAAITNSINPTICSNGSYVYDGVTYDANNTTGTHIFTSALGCDSTVTVTLTIQNQITHNIETTICYGDSIVVNGVIYNGNNSIGQEIISLPNGCDSVININVTEIVPDTAYIDTIIYVGQSLDIAGVVLIESDFEGIVYLQASNGCDSIVSVKVLMLYESTHFVPSGFSPNGDGVNDFIGVMGGGIEEMEFSIFNRWGELIFNADCCCSQACLWDGKYRNQIQNVGTYVYYLNGIYTNGMPFKEKGTISLIK